MYALEGPGVALVAESDSRGSMFAVVNVTVAEDAGPVDPADVGCGVVTKGLPRVALIAGEDVTGFSMVTFPSILLTFVTRGIPPVSHGRCSWEDGDSLGGEVGEVVGDGGEKVVIGLDRGDWGTEFFNKWGEVGFDTRRPELS